MDDWLISHIPGSGKKSATDAKRKSMKLSKAKIDKNRPKKITGAFDVGVGEKV